MLIAKTLFGLEPDEGCEAEERVLAVAECDMYVDVAVATEGVQQS